MSWLCELLDRNSSDPRERLELGQQIVARLQTQRLPYDSKTINSFCDVVYQWLGASNYKVSLLAIEILDVTLSVSGDVIVPYLLDRIPPLVERLGDAKQPVREAAVQLVCSIAYQPPANPHIILEKITPGLTHRQWLVKNGTMDVMRRIVNTSGTEVEVELLRLIPTFCKLMGDPNSEVRDGASTSLATLMNVFGPDVAQSIRSRQLVPDSKLAQIASRCSEALRNSPVANRPRAQSRQQQQNTTPRSSIGSRFDQENRNNRETKVPLQRSIGARAMSVPAVKRPAMTTSKGTVGGAGAVSEEEIRNAFNTPVPKVSITSAHDVVSQMEHIGTILSDTNNDWEKRTNALKILRGISQQGGLSNYEDVFVSSLTKLSDGLLASVKDLRSQVVKEACITISFLSEELGTKLLRIVEAILLPLIQLVQNSAKVMASCGGVCSQYIIKNVQTPKLLPLLFSCRNSKSREVRRHVQLLTQLVLAWPQQCVDKHMSEMVETVKSGINDADPQARTAARVSYQLLETNYPQQARFLYQTLDPSKQRSLGGVSQSSSSQSIVSERDQLPMTRRPGPGLGSLSRAQGAGFFNARSASAIDSKAVSSLRRPVITGLRRPAPTGLPPPTSTASLRSRPQMAPVSQPTSRSTSPSRTIKQARQLLSRGNTQTNMRARDGSPGRNGTNGTSGARPNGGLMPNEMSALLAKVQAEFGTDVDDSLPVLTSPRIQATSSAKSSPDRVTLDGAELNNALRLCSSSQVGDRRDGLRCIVGVCQSGKILSGPEVKKVSDTLTRLLNEGNHQLVSYVTEAIRAFVESHASQLNDWIPLLLQRLLSKSGTEIIPTSMHHYENALATVQNSVTPQVQLTALCKMLPDRIMSPPTKVKGRILDFLHKLLSKEDVHLAINTSDVRAALNMIFQWVEDQKLASIHPMCERVIRGFFLVSAAEFSNVLSTFPPQLREYAHGLLKSGTPTLNGNFTPRNGAALKDITHQIEAMTMSSAPSLRNATSNMSSIRSPMARSPAPPPQSAPPSRLPPMVLPRERDSVESSPFSHLETSTSFPESDFDSQLESTIWMANDEKSQRNRVADMLDELASDRLDVARRDIQRTALSTLYQMMSEGSFTLWDEFFKPLVVRLFDIMKLDDFLMQKMGFRLLTKMCRIQAARFSDIAEMTILKVLALSPDAVPQVTQCAEECARVLATHLPTPTVVTTILSIVDQQEDERVQAALKMLVALIESLDYEEIAPLMEDICPRLINSFNNNEQAKVRKAAVNAIVASNLKAPAEMNRYLQSLPENKQKLVHIYIQRAQSASTHF